MIFEENYIYAGKILKTYGYEGNFLIAIEHSVNAYLKQKEPIFILIDGIYVPFFIEKYQAKGNGTFIIKFDHIHTDYDADEFTGLQVFIRDNIQKNKDKSSKITGLKGYIFMDTSSGMKGIVTDVVQIPGNPLLEVTSDNNKKYSIPFHHDLVDQIKTKKKLLIMKLPQGLIDMKDQK